MRFYKVVLKTLPSVMFAHSYETDAYNISFKRNVNRLEFSYVEKGDVVKAFKNGGREFRKAPFVCSEPYLDEITNTSTEPHKHYTFCISSDIAATEITAQEVLLAKQDILSQNGYISAILSDCVYDKKFISSAEMLIKKIIYKNSISTYSEGLSALADVFKLLSLFTEYSFMLAQKEENSNISPSDTIYCDRAKKYIAKNIGRKIPVSDISKEVGISSGHLSRIFREVTGSSLIEYINRMKISLAKELFETKNSSVRDTAQTVGIEDEKYFSRLFKEYTGMTASEYKKQLNYNLSLREKL